MRKEVSGTIADFGKAYNQSKKMSENTFRFVPDDAHIPPMNVPTSAFPTGYTPKVGDKITLQMVDNQTEQPINFDLNRIDDMSKIPPQPVKPKSEPKSEPGSDGTVHHSTNPLEAILKGNNDSDDNSEKQHYDPKQAENVEDYGYITEDAYKKLTNSQNPKIDSILSAGESENNSGNKYADNNSEAGNKYANAENILDEAEEKAEEAAKKTVESNPAKERSAAKSDLVILGIVSILAGILSATSCFMGGRSMMFNVATDFLLAFSLVYGIISLVQVKKYGHKFSFTALLTVILSIVILAMSTVILPAMITYAKLGTSGLLAVVGIISMLHKSGIKSVTQEAMDEANAETKSAKKKKKKKKKSGK